jgi:site-specific recombinase XerC
LNTDQASPPTVITRDNFHLSEPTSRGPTTPIAFDFDRALVDGCTNPKVLELIAAATAPNTLRAYDRDIAHFLAWGGTITADPKIVAEYFAAHSNILSMATLARRVVAIRRAHVLRSLPDPTKTDLVRLTLRGVRRLHGCPQRRVAPLRAEHLSAIVSILGPSLRDVRDQALLLVGFAGAFRRSELTAIDCKWIERQQQGIVITLPRSKTDQYGRGRDVAIVRIGGPICPVAALERWLTTSEIADGSLFRRVSKAGRVLGNPLSASAVATVVKQRVAQIGLDPARYSGHSLRAGFATSAAAAGLPIWKIKSQTGHVSDAVLGRYIRDADLFISLADGWSANFVEPSLLRTRQRQPTLVSALALFPPTLSGCANRGLLAPFDRRQG